MLNISRNNLKAKAGIEVLKAVARSGSVKSLDMSWNLLGLRLEKSASLAMALEEALADNVLRHLDLSYNHIPLPECMFIGEVLKGNHEVYGLHMEGNECELDTDGFLSPPKFVGEARLVQGKMS